METNEKRLERIKTAPIGDLTIIEVVDANREEEASRYVSENKRIIDKLNNDGKVIISVDQYEIVKDQARNCIVVFLPNNKVMIELDI